MVKTTNEEYQSYARINLSIQRLEYNSETIDDLQQQRHSKCKVFTAFYILSEPLC